VIFSENYDTFQNFQIRNNVIPSLSIRKTFPNRLKNYEISKFRFGFRNYFIFLFGFRFQPTKSKGLQTFVKFVSVNNSFSTIRIISLGALIWQVVYKFVKFRKSLPSPQTWICRQWTWTRGSNSPRYLFRKNRISPFYGRILRRIWTSFPRPLSTIPRLSEGQKVWTVCKVFRSSWTIVDNGLPMQDLHRSRSFWIKVTIPSFHPYRRDGVRTHFFRSNSIFFFVRNAERSKFTFVLERSFERYELCVMNFIF